MLTSVFSRHPFPFLLLAAQLQAHRSTAVFESGSPSRSFSHRESLRELFDKERAPSSQSTLEWNPPYHADLHQIEKDLPADDVAAHFHDLIFVHSRHYKQAVAALEASEKGKHRAFSSSGPPRSSQIGTSMPSQSLSKPTTSSGHVSSGSSLQSVSRGWGAGHMKVAVKALMSRCRKPACLKSKQQ